MNKMKKITLLACLFMMMGILSAQKVALVNAQEILEALPEYKEARTELAELTASWEKKIEEDYNELDEMYRKYDAEQVLLDDEMRRQKQEDLYKREGEIRDYQKSKFGPDGELFEKRTAMIEPIQEKIYQAIEQFSSTNDIDIMLDRNGSAGVLFANDKYDVTSQIIKILKN